MKNAPQHQDSTEEQLEWLRAFYTALKDSIAQPKDVYQLKQLANVQGLYDAADHVVRKSHHTTDLNKMMEW